MRWRDISIPLREGMAVWPGDQPFEPSPSGRIAWGGEANITRLVMSCHCGTHVDAPRHFVEGGATIDQLDLDTLTGPCYVLDLTDRTTPIVAADLRGLPQDVERLLIRTRNSALLGDGVFHQDYIGLSLDAGRWIVARGIKLVGLDYLSVASMADNTAVHQLMLGKAGSVILESIDLSGVAQGWYELICLPMPVYGADGAPARVLLGEMKK